jgi:integrase
MVLERHKELIKTTRCKTDNHTAANGTMRILKSVYGFAKERYRINGNPLITEDPTKVLRWRWYPSKIRQGTVPDTKLPQFFNVVMSAEAKVARDFIMFLLLTALRRNEAGRLKWENIDFENKTLTIPAGFNKSKRPHVLPLTPILLAILESRFEGRKHSDYVFPGRDSNKSINEPRQTLLHMRNIMGWHWLLHDLRRTALSAAEKAGVPYLAIQKIANHSVNQRVTDRYLILDVEFLRPHMLTMNERLMSCMNITVEKWQRLDEERLAMQRAKGGFSETAYLEITGCKRELAGKVITDVKTEPEEEEEFYW